MPEDLEFKSMPWELSHIWAWWHQLNKTRQINMEVNHIEYKEILAWSTLLQIKLQPLEVEALITIDTAFVTSRRKKVEESQ